MKSFIKRYDTVAQNFEGTTLTAEELSARRAQSKTEQGRRQRGRAIKGTAALALTALAVSGAPRQGAEVVADSVKAGAGTVATNVETFGEVTASNLKTVAEVPHGVLSAVNHELDKIWQGDQVVRDNNADSMGLTAERREQLGNQANEAMQAEMGIDQQPGRDLERQAFTDKP